MGSLRMFFGTQRQKNSEGETCYPPLLIHKICPYHKFPETQKGSLTKFIGTVKQKSSSRKSWNRTITHRFFSNGGTLYPPPILKVYFYIRKTLKHKRFFHEVYWYCGKKFPTQNRENPSYAFIASKPQTFENTEGFPHDVFRKCETKRIRRKNVILSPDHDLSSIVFFHTTSFLKHKKVPHGDFNFVRLQKFDGKTWEHPLLLQIFFHTRTFFKHKRIPPQSFLVLWS